VSTSPNFIQSKPRIFGEFVGNVLSHTVIGFPNDGTTYYWWVWGGNEAGITHHADTRANGRSFINGEAPTIPSAPTLISPDEGEQF